MTESQSRDENRVNEIVIMNFEWGVLGIVEAQNWLNSVNENCLNDLDRICSLVRVVFSKYKSMTRRTWQILSKAREARPKPQAYYFRRYFTLTRSTIQNLYLSFLGSATCRT